MPQKRLRLWRLGDGRHLLLVALHHIIGDARFSYTTLDEKWEAAIFVNNIADENYLVQTFDLGAVVGMTDLDALTASIAQSARASGDIPLYARALASGMLANTLLKLTVALVVGRGAFRWATALGLGAMAVAIGLSLIL